ncbi:MAG TPA: FUSC family protein [Trebonia sp.]
MSQPWWKPVWSVPAAMRAVRATVVVPSLFALTFKVIGDPQIALFATFGGFATLVIASFSGTKRDKFIAHLGLAVVGSLALIIGTLVSGTTWLAALITVPVTFAIFFAGVGGPNAASGSAAAMFAYVLPVASAGGVATIPARLEGWWLASAAGTLAVLLFSPRPPGDRLRAAMADLSAEIASRLRAAANGEATQPQAMRAAKERLVTAFTAAPFRPTGLATSDQALNSLVQLLEWGVTQLGDAFDGHIDMTKACAADRALLREAAQLFTDTSDLLSGKAADPDFTALEQARVASAAELRELSARGNGGREPPMREEGTGEPDARIAAAHAVHAQAIAVVARGAAADALMASRRAAPETIDAVRRAWYGAEGKVTAAPGSGPDSQNGRGRLSGFTSSPRVAGLSRATFLVTRHATVRSVWFLNSLRGALALAAAVAIADLSGVQHGFWVVLGTLSVLRTSAASTGATAWRALAGTVIGFVVGALLLLAIGTGQTSLWVALPVAVAIAAYSGGTMPFLVGQAAFTIVIVVLFNLLVPVGWTVGLLRIEDVAIGCAVSLVVGVLFWPRGVSSVVAEDLADAFRRGAEYLSQAVDWALSELMVPPAAALGAVSAGIRLDDAVRGYLTEQGSKRVSKEDLWALVNASTRLRLTANTLAGLRQAETAPGLPPGAACLPLPGSEEYAGAPACMTLRSVAGSLTGFYDHVAEQVSHPREPGALAVVPPPATMGPAVPRRPGAASDGAAAGADGKTPAAADGKRPAAADGKTPAAADGTAPAVATAPAAGSVGGPAVADGGPAADHGAPAGAATAVHAAPSEHLPHPHLLWVQEHLHHLSYSAQTVSEPAHRLAEIRQRPWWR